ncbi:MULTISPECIES: acetate--CoA ligase [unclassified Rathayibacter]|uniref:acetate--CoA ligase n=1 Tax=unclassified Rathayibacter TaxID=2609250 RepID=UPI000CE81BA0|nr:MULTISPECIES: acetate--CoA ligase [unclassified Rathayibacter]PPH17234.1 acetate--CoA ligase [Rathayibacter sp. AY1F8]PPH21038.1 acetate--CoA ligase [Rathayibacter sp. AY1C4]PPH32017.1 acetate--CoA ligase [Rathayibacter sp. AY1F9]PPH77106.1 acetate--CoA ligase [Rathayibacter sp. AY1D4]PPH90751.1 acetate--CoA ligase [Rathayibacter sp. AY1D3]
MSTPPDAPAADRNAIDNLLHETRRFPPPADLAAGAVATAALYDEAAADRLAFWADRSRELLHWHRPFTRTLDWSEPPFAKWFDDGELNVAYNCLDRHVLAGHGDRVALHWEGEPGDSRSITYAELTAEVKRAANLLTSLGVRAGDRVAIYLPMIPEAVIAMLAVARLGAVHSVVFGGFSAESLRARIDDAEATLVITADGGWRKGAVSPLKPAVDAALALGGESSVQHVLVVRRGGNEVAWHEGRDLWWHEEIVTVDADHVAKPFPAEQPLFILYTSGTTGKPKGILHTSGGYLTQVAFTHRAVFDLHPESDVYWSTADVGWITGHSYVVYGPLANGATQVMYEGTPDSPHPGRWWEIVEKHGVTILYAAPTAIRSFMKLGRQIPQRFDLSSLRLLGSVGEPINPEAWVWYRDVIGGGRTPIVDTWWQTETGAMMVSPLPGVTTLKPGSAQVALPGISIDVVDDAGTPVGADEGGLLVITEPWPAMLRGIWGDPERYVETYWSKFGDRYFAGDGARRDQDGDLWLLGRVDDVMNVSGHRLSTAEIESALVSHPVVAEAAVVGAADETTGQAVVAFVIAKASQAEALAHGHDELEATLKAHVAEHIGAIARPKRIFVVQELPKTRSGKIMRRLLRDVAEGRAVGDTTTLADTQVMAVISSAIAAD